MKRLLEQLGPWGIELYRSTGGLLGLVRNVRHRLEASENVSESGDPDTWYAVGNNPRLSVEGVSLLPGWQAMELQVEHEYVQTTARLYVDYGEGFREQEVFQVPLRSGARADRLVYFPRMPRRLRLEPVERPGTFAVRLVRFTWVPTPIALRYVLARLLTMHMDWTRVLPHQGRRQLALEAARMGTRVSAFAVAQYNRTFERRCLTHGYEDWLQAHESLPASAWQQRADSVKARLDPVSEGQARATGKSAPFFSVVMPIHGPPSTWLRESLESLQAQYFANWELCVVCDAATHPEVPAVLDQFVTRDSRFRVEGREVGGQVSVAGNLGLAMANGQFVAWLDPGDRLAPDALLVLAERLADDSDVAMVYSDEDRLTAGGERFDPHFKPDWNPDLALSLHYVSRLVAYRRDRLEAIGGFREHCEGAAEHDLLLRFAHGLPAESIHHVARVLYHRRVTVESNSLVLAHDARFSGAGMMAVREQVRRVDPDATVEPGLVPGSHRVCWSLPEALPLVSLIIPTRDRVEILRPCVDAILQRTDYPHFEILVVDNESRCPETLAYLDTLRADPRIRVLEWHRSFNYSAINNFAVRQAHGDLIGLVNNDIEPINGGWLTEMVRQVARPEIGCVGAKLYYPDDTIQHAGVITGLLGCAGHGHKDCQREDSGYRARLKVVQNYSVVTAACLLVERSVYEKVGGLEEKHLAVAFNDVDFCLKVQEAGYRNLWTPYAEAYHHESLSRGADDTPAKRRRAEREVAYMRRRWGETLRNDPAYNPNLTLAREDFSLR